MGLRGVLAGALVLIALQTLVQSSAAGRVAGLLGVPGQIARRIVDPTVAAIPDLRPAMGSGVIEPGEYPSVAKTPTNRGTGD